MAKEKSLDVNRMLSRLGLTHPAEALFYVPRAFKDYRHPVRYANQLVEGREQLGIFRVESKAYFDKDGNPGGKPFRVDVMLRDGHNQQVRSGAFGNVWDWRDVNPGDEVAIYGTVKQFGRTMTLSNIEFVPKYLHGKMTPVYPAVKSKATAETIHNLTRVGLREISDAGTLLAANIGLREDDLAKASGFSSLETFFRAMHTPASPDEFSKAIKGALELCKAETLERARRVHSRAPSKESVLLVDKDAAKAFKAFNLTGDQFTGATEILVDLRSPMPMRRLLSGDVGTGKTATYMIAAAAAFRAGGDVHIIAPNAPLCTQLMNELNTFYPDIPVELVTSKAKPKHARGAVLIGTTALVNFAIKHDVKPHLLIVDEQHKLSREQRELVCGPHTNVLEATATAIPRSMALITHGGMEVSVLRDSPVVKKLHTSITDTPESRADSHREIARILAEGGQVAVVYPLVADDDESELVSVESAFVKWEAEFPGRVSMAHGKMKAEEKDAVINAFKAGEKSVLVCSTVVEVGLTIPNLRGIFIKNAERYGATQLHQLRGRLARKGGEGWMYLDLPNGASDEAYARLQLLVDETDGFKIAEADMEMRGFGDLGETSDDQSGSAVLTLKNVKVKPSHFRENKEAEAPVVQTQVEKPANPPYRPSAPARQPVEEPAPAPQRKRIFF